MGQSAGMVDWWHDFAFAKKAMLFSSFWQKCLFTTSPVVLYSTKKAIAICPNLASKIILTKF